MNARYTVLNTWLQRVTTRPRTVPIVCTLGWGLPPGLGWGGADFLVFRCGPRRRLMRLVIVRAGMADLTDRLRSR
jgi:hypothetical protein